MSFPSPSPVARNGEEPPLEKKKKKKASSLVLPHNTISSLPDDLVLNCFARISKLYYPALSLVSKKFRLLLASPELYKTRSLLGRTESCIYVCLRYNEDSDPLWFTLCLKPNQNQTKKKKKSSGYVLATIPVAHSRPVHWGSVVAVGSNIYAIGGSTLVLGSWSYNSQPSSSVWILDCTSHTWHEAPSMRVERDVANANVFDGKIYIAGGCCQDKDSSYWMEVLDPKTRTWENVLCPVAESCMSEIGKSAVVEGAIFMFGNCKGVAYKPKEDRWVSLGGLTLMDIEWVGSSYCVIDNVLYCYRHSMLQRGIIWYNSKIGFWVKLLGLKGLPKIAKYSSVKLVCYGGKMAVLWDKNLPSSSGYKTIWCVVIALEKRKNNEEIWGNVESLDDDVLTVPSSYEFGCALNATV